MQRRMFLKGSAAMSAAGAGAGLGAAGMEASAMAEPAAGKAREFYVLRRYTMQTGPQQALAENYFAQALIPALNRMGIQPVGAFRVDIGPQTPTYYVLMPGMSVETLVNVDLKLPEDASFMKAAEPFWHAPATAVAFKRVESTLLAAFEGWPKLVLPPAAAGGGLGKRIFQMRTYESPSHFDHALKVHMFHDGEFELFQKAGFHQVFFGDALIGEKLPQLTYMLSFPDMATLESSWDKFKTDPEWAKLSHSPKYAAEAIVSNIDNLILSPLSCSQI